MRGVIYDLNGNKEIDFALGLGYTSNSKVKVLVSLQGLLILRMKGVPCASILGDSSIVIKLLYSQAPLNNCSLSRFSLRVIALYCQFKSMSFYQILS